MKEWLSDLWMQGQDAWYEFRLRKNKLSLITDIPWGEVFQRNSRSLTIGIAVMVLTAAVVIWASNRPDRGEQKKALPSLQMRDDKGDEWMLEIIQGQPRNQVKQKEPGAPLKVMADVQIQGHDISIGVLVLGQAEEKYVAGAKKNSVWEPPPTFQVLDEAGNELVQGRFKYG